ncbi:uncharacterized protein K02A2.6-like [Nilaparvata lugens]|uniref:uncharacterized protein K02A2.6-like n=1 Tax=Nilaparvata lugens TaxID=108931 RepID=UPI00193E3FD2|nr:uncharacterized protein K02A2.6-like [Nilaparvata lugens]
MIFHPGKNLLTMMVGCLMRYAAFLSGFDYLIEHRRSDLHCNADYLSRSPITLEVPCDDEDDLLLAHTVQSISSDTITSDIIKQETDADPELSVLKANLLTSTVQNPEFCLQHGIIFRGVRVVIPKKLQPRILQDLHDTHTGVVKMKALARRHCYWENIDKYINAAVRSCRSCCEFKADPKEAPLHVWDIPESNWQCVHMDYAGPYKGNYYLILVDAKSKWPEIAVTATPPTTNSTIRMLREIFSHNGLPEILVSDNATLFTSNDFQAFRKRNGIKQRFIAPGHPATNELAERYVQTFKKKLKTMTSDEGTHHEKFHAALFRLPVTPLESGETPAELFMGRSLRTHLDIYKPTIPDIKLAVQPPPELVRHLPLGARVQAHNYTTSGKWCYRTIVECLGRLHYLVELDEGYTIKRHIDQLQLCEIPLTKNALDQSSPIVT